MTKPHHDLQGLHGVTGCHCEQEERGHCVVGGPSGHHGAMSGCSGAGVRVLLLTAVMNEADVRVQYSIVKHDSRRKAVCVL